jgi:hypothetical protein
MPKTACSPAASRNSGFCAETITGAAAGADQISLGLLPALILGFMTLSKRERHDIFIGLINPGDWAQIAANVLLKTQSLF